MSEQTINENDKYIHELSIELSKINKILESIVQKVHIQDKEYCDLMFNLEGSYGDILNYIANYVGYKFKSKLITDNEMDDVLKMGVDKWTNNK